MDAIILRAGAVESTNKDKSSLVDLDGSVKLIKQIKRYKTIYPIIGSRLISLI